MAHPFELDQAELAEQLENMVQTTMSDLKSEFLEVPKGEGFIEYPDFRDAFEDLKRQTENFTDFTVTTVHHAVRTNSRILVVLRTILGMTAPEWAELVQTELDVKISQTAARNLDRSCRNDPAYVRRAEERHEQRVKNAERRKKEPPPLPKGLEQISALTQVAVDKISKGAPPTSEGIVHRLSKFDTAAGLESVQYATAEGVPYAMLLYERYLGRPFAGHRDAISELIGAEMENAIETQLRAAGITYRKTKRAERIPRFDQAPDFCIPDEVSPIVVIEAKIASDDGTVRDKVTRIKNLVTQRNKHVAEHGFHPYQVLACIDGRGFRQRSEDMRQLLVAVDGKVFTPATLDRMVDNSRLRELRTILSS